MRSLFNALMIAALTGFWSVLAIICVPFSSTGVVCWIARVWGRMVTAACGVDVEIGGLDQRFDAPAYLVMANHTSHFDVISIFSRLPIDMRPVAKRELGYIPIFGWVLWLGAAIMIDRGDRGKAIRSIERAGKAIRGGRSVLMFPEGTRTPPGELGSMKKGPFHLAIASRVPVLPVGVEGTGRVLAKGDWRIRPGLVRIRVGAPIPTADLPDTEEARAELAEAVRKSLETLMRA